MPMMDLSCIFASVRIGLAKQSCRLWAIRQRLRGEWHECCDVCYPIFRQQRIRGEKHELDIKSDRIHRTDPSSRVPIAILTPDSKAQRCRNLQKRVIMVKRKNERLELKFSMMNNIEFPVGDSFRDSLSVAYEYCNGNHEMFRIQCLTAPFDIEKEENVKWNDTEKEAIIICMSKAIKDNSLTLSDKEAAKELNHIKG